MSGIVGAMLLLGGAPVAAAPGTADPPGPGPQQQAGAQTDGEKVEPGPAVWTGSPGTNLAYQSYGYPWPAAPDCDESNVAGGSCINDGLGFFQGQCTSWVAYRLNQRNGIAFSNWFEGRRWGNAADWAQVAKEQGYRRDQVPAVGAVGWYRRGHVSYIEDVLGDGSIVVSEMNTDGRNGFRLVTVRPGDASWPDKFIHLADVVPVDLTPPARPGQLAASAPDGGVALTWAAPADDVGVTGYRVLRNGTPLAETDAPSYVDRQASPGQAYTYTVEAFDAAGNVSAPASVVLDPAPPAPARLSGNLFDPTVVPVGSSFVVCGRLGTERDQRVGCRLRTLDGWRTVRTGRHVPWGLPDTRAFVGDQEGKIWFCREVPGGRTACVPLDVAARSWGYDRISTARSLPGHASWVATPAGPARCGLLRDRAACTIRTEDGWRGPLVASRARPGDPLSRAFVPTERGVAFCRHVDGRPTCTELGSRRLAWIRTVTLGKTLPHGRWLPRRSGPALCPVGGGECQATQMPTPDQMGPVEARSRQTRS